MRTKEGEHSDIRLGKDVEDLYWHPLRLSRIVDYFLGMGHFLGEQFRYDLFDLNDRRARASGKKYYVCRLLERSTKVGSCGKGVLEMRRK